MCQRMMSILRNFFFKIHWDTNENLNDIIQSLWRRLNHLDGDTWDSIWKGLKKSQKVRRYSTPEILNFPKINSLSKMELNSATQEHKKISTGKGKVRPIHHFDVSTVRIRAYINSSKDFWKSNPIEIWGREMTFIM